MFKMMIHLPKEEYELIKRMQQAKTQEEHDKLERELELVLKNKNKMEEHVLSRQKSQFNNLKGQYI